MNLPPVATYCPARLADFQAHLDRHPELSTDTTREAFALLIAEATMADPGGGWGRLSGLTKFVTTAMRN